MRSGGTYCLLRPHCYSFLLGDATLQRSDRYFFDRRLYSLLKTRFWVAQRFKHCDKAFLFSEDFSRKRRVFCKLFTR
jgi:hypothetical protein